MHFNLEPKIKNLNPANPTTREQAAQILLAAFREHWPQAWPNLAAAQEEVAEALKEGRICRGAFGPDGRLLGWIAALPEYNGHTWELHPLAVHPDYQGQGLGQALLRDLENQVASRGATTLFLGSDDEDGMTSLAGIDLYPDIPGSIANIKNLKGHPYSFYQRLGYTIVGVVPDANGPGKPDILMAKRLNQPGQEEG